METEIEKLKDFIVEINKKLDEKTDELNSDVVNTNSSVDNIIKELNSVLLNILLLSATVEVFLEMFIKTDEDKALFSIKLEKATQRLTKELQNYEQEQRKT